MREEHGFILKDYDIFKKTKNNVSSIPKHTPDTKLPEMNSIEDYATWVVKQIPEEEKIRFIKNL